MGKRGVLEGKGEREKMRMEGGKERENGRGVEGVEPTLCTVQRPISDPEKRKEKLGSLGAKPLVDQKVEPLMVS